MLLPQVGKGTRCQLKFWAACWTTTAVRSAKPRFRSKERSSQSPTTADSSRWSWRRLKSRVALTVAAEGYVSNTKVHDPKATGINVIVIWPIGYRVKFDPSRDFDIELGSSRIQLPANALTGPGEEKLAGPVALRFTLFDVTRPLQRAAAPGDFSGKMLDRSIRRLNSFGIFDLAAHDLKGRVLSVRRGAKVDLAIPIPRKLADKAPRQVGYFDFNASVGRWVQVGSFELAPRRADAGQRNR